MDFGLSQEQQEWHDSATKFARDRLIDDLLGRDERREFWREGWQLCAEFGIQGLPIPVEYGGRGQGLPVTIAAMEGLGYGCPDNGLIFAMNASMWTNSIPILRYGTEDQKRRFLPSLCDGTFVGANGASEVEAGSDIFSMTA
ncbi:acyl-CoA dehydrogenase family protein, partial [Singulisphaera rosea]